MVTRCPRAGDRSATWSRAHGALRAYMGFSYIKYSRTNFIPFYYITEVLNLRPYWTAILGGPAA